MGDTKHVMPTDEAVASGFGTVDEKGRICLSKAVRGALGIEPGSHVAFVALDDAVLIIPQDEHLATLMRRAEQALSAAGLIAQDLLNELPSARADVITEAYDAEFLREIQRLHEESLGTDQTST